MKVGYKKEGVPKLVQKPSEQTDVIVQNSSKAHKVWLKKTESTKTAKFGLGFSLFTLKIHIEVSRHIIVEKVDEEGEIQV